ncbi:MAG: adenylate/guanylate cyclase domain-containing protein [Burkholderiales bacterium]|nr:adenylate/guanylate cyclase domain-containing protein [Burkholderiales bacterium]
MHFTLLLIVFLLAARAVEAAPTSLDAQTRAPIDGITVLPDPKGTLTRDAVEAATFSAPAGPASATTAQVYWLKIPVANGEPRARELMIELPAWDDVTLWQRTSDGWVSARAGILVPFAERSLPLTLMWHMERTLLPVRLAAGEETVLLARATSAFRYFDSLPLTAKLRDGDMVRATEKRQRFFQALFQGFVVALLLYNLVLMFAMRDVSYFYYVLGLGAYGVIAAGNAQFTTAFLWPNHPHWDFEYFPWAATAATIGTLHFARHYLDTPRYLPRIDKLVALIPIIAVAVLALSPWLPWKFTNQFMDKLAIPVYLGALGLAVWSVIARHPLRHYFFAAHASLAVGNLLWLVHNDYWRAWGLPAPSSLPWNFGQIGLALEGILLSLGLAHRIKRLDQEKRTLIEGQRAELESRVRERTLELSAERERSEALLVNILPASVAEELKRDGKAQARRHEEVTVLFTDFAGFTQTMASVPPQRLVQDLDEIFGAFDDIVVRHGLEKIKTIGDAYMAAAGLPEAVPDHAARAVRAALEMQSWMAARNESASIKWRLRIGLHSGHVVAGVVGKRKYAYDVWGDTVNIASRMESAGEPGRVNVSAYTWDLVRSEFAGTYRGQQAAKGKGDMDMYFIDGPLAGKNDHVMSI